MWVIRRGHRHIDGDTLSEYLDGRLPVATAARVDRGLAACVFCRRELEGLQSVLSLLQQLPDVPVRRRFTLAGPPAEPVAPRPALPLRAPQWAYAAAASAAALVLAVLVSADASGLLAPRILASPQGMAAQAEETAAANATRPVELQPVALESEAAIVSQAAPAPSAAVEAKPGSDLLQEPAPVAQAEASVESEQAPPQAAKSFAVDRAVATQLPLEPAAAAIQGESEPSAPADETGAAGPATFPQPVPEQVPEIASPPVVATGNPLVVWRVLEGLAAAAGLVFLTAMFLKRRAARRIFGV